MRIIEVSLTSSFSNNRLLLLAEFISGTLKEELGNCWQRICILPSKGAALGQPGPPCPGPLFCFPGFTSKRFKTGVPTGRLPFDLQLCPGSSQLGGRGRSIGYNKHFANEVKVEQLFKSRELAGGLVLYCFRSLEKP